MKFLTFLAVAFIPSFTAASTQLCDQYGYYAANGYYFNNNAWGQSSGTGSQCLTVFNTAGGGVSWQADWTWSGGQNNVKSYPYSGRTFSSKQLISKIGSLSTSAQWSYTGSSIRADVSYDIFTSSNPNHSTSSGDYELMIWLAAYGSVQPIGSSVGQVTVGGLSWTLWSGYNGAMEVYSFVAPSPRTSWSGDIKSFFNYLQQNKGFPASSQYLLTTEFGSEPFTGGPATFQVQNWNVADV